MSDLRIRRSNITNKQKDDPIDPFMSKETMLSAILLSSSESEQRRRRSEKLGKSEATKKQRERERRRRFFLERKGDKWDGKEIMK